MYFWKCQKQRGKPTATLARTVGATKAFKRRCRPDDQRERGGRDARGVCRSSGAARSLGRWARCLSAGWNSRQQTVGLVKLALLVRQLDFRYPRILPRLRAKLAFLISQSNRSPLALITSPSNKFLDRVFGTRYTVSAAPSKQAPMASCTNAGHLL